MMDNKRIFGSGPKCIVFGILVFVLGYLIENLIVVPKMIISDVVSLIIFWMAIALTLIISIWGFKSLPIDKRGRELVTTGAFAYFRHPIYAAFIDFFALGVVFYFKSWILLIAWVVMVFVCGKLVDNEEEYVISKFGKKYLAYQKKVKKFIPGIY